MEQELLLPGAGGSSAVSSGAAAAPRSPGCTRAVCSPARQGAAPHRALTLSRAPLPPKLQLEFVAKISHLNYAVAFAKMIV